MKYFRIVLLYVLSFAAVSCLSDKAERIKIIFETDMGNDIDDALALDMLYKYMDERIVDLLAVGVNKTGYGPVEFVDIMNTWYGYPNIPIGKITEGIDYNYPESNYAAKVVDMNDLNGENIYRTSVSDYSALPETVELYRKVLSEQPDNSVTIVSVGFSTNIVKLLFSGPDKWSEMAGKELIAAKVKLLSIMAADFSTDAKPEFNVLKDIASAKLIFEEWPSEIVVSPFEVGVSILYPASSIESDFSWTIHHPLVDAYKAWGKMPYDRPTWDLTSVLYAVEGEKWFTLSPYGNIEVDTKGYTVFTPNKEGNIRYLSVDQRQADSILVHFLNIIPKQPENIIR